MDSSRPWVRLSILPHCEAEGVCRYLSGPAVRWPASLQLVQIRAGSRVSSLVCPPQCVLDMPNSQHRVLTMAGRKKSSRQCHNATMPSSLVLREVERRLRTGNNCGDCLCWGHVRNCEGIVGMALQATQATQASQASQASQTPRQEMGGWD